MSRIWTKGVKALEWNHRFVAIYKCASADKRPEEIIVANRKEIDANLNLKRVLDVLRQELVNKRIYNNADNPTTRFLTFRAYEDGQANDAKEILGVLLGATKKSGVKSGALAMSKRYLETTRSQKGVLIFLLADAGLQGGESGRCLFIFKCDFENISQLRAGTIFRPIADAIIEKTKKGSLFPYFQDGRFDDTTVRVFDELGETQYWLDFLELGDRPPQFMSLRQATIETWAQLHPALFEEYKGKFATLPEERARKFVRRPLFGDEQLIETAHRSDFDETRGIIAAVVAKVEPRPVTLHLDRASVRVPLAEYGESWVIAEQAGTRFILIKGFQLESATDVNPLDFAAPLSLEEARRLLGL